MLFLREANRKAKLKFVCVCVCEGEGEAQKKAPRESTRTIGGVMCAEDTPLARRERERKVNKEPSTKKAKKKRRVKNRRGVKEKTLRWTLQKRKRRL